MARQPGYGFIWPLVTLVLPSPSLQLLKAGPVILKGKIELFAAQRKLSLYNEMIFKAQKDMKSKYLSQTSSPIWELALVSKYLLRKFGCTIHS